MNDVDAGVVTDTHTDTQDKYRNPAQRVNKTTLWPARNITNGVGCPLFGGKTVLSLCRLVDQKVFFVLYQRFHCMWVIISYPGLNPLSCPPPLNMG